MVTFEGYERRIEKINACMKKYGIKDLEDAKAICNAKGIDVEAIVKGVQQIAFENAEERIFEEIRCVYRCVYRNCL